MYLLDLNIEYRVIIGLSAMVLLFSGFLIAFIIIQQKKIQYHKDLQILHEKQHHILSQQNSLLEQRVQERTGELLQQKEALQTSLSDLKAAQLYLVLREKMASLGELTAGIAHEIQNPLNFITNFSEVSIDIVDELKEEIKANHPDDALAITDDLTANLQKIMHHGGRVSHIIKGMLEHSRPSIGEPVLTDLNALTAEYLRLAYNVLKTKDQDVTVLLLTDFDPHLGPAEVIPQEIGRVLLNLFNNAFYAIRQKNNASIDGYQPEVRVSTHQLTGGVEIKVRDNGVGIPKRIIQKIFQPFFTTKPTGQGTGLGLSLSYDVISKGHSGRLAVDSVEGEFTEFVITLPE